MALKPADTSSLGKAILAAVEKRPGISTSDLARSLGKTHDLVRRKCYRLRNAGQLIGSPVINPREWFLPAQPQDEESLETAVFKMPPAPNLF